MFDDRDFLKALKPGDEVILKSYNPFYHTATIETVEKITPKGFIRVKAMLFDPVRNRCRSGEQYYLQEATPKRKEEITRAVVVKKAYDNLSRLERYNITYEAALKINKLVDELLNERRGEDE